MDNFQKILAWIPQLLAGARITILLTICSVCAGLFLSIFLALGTMSKKKIIRGICNAYVFFFRGTPLLVQLFIIFYGLPTIGVKLDPIPSAIIAFSLNVISAFFIFLHFSYDIVASSISCDTLRLLSAACSLTGLNCMWDLSSLTGYQTRERQS